jgi:type I restriction enzyme S subunit
MIEGLKPYSQYKQTGSTWLGAIPSHWEEVPLGRVLVQRIEQNRPVKTTEILSLSLRQGVIPYSEKKSGGNKAKSDLSAYTLAYPGDIVLNSMNVVVGSVGLSKYYGAVSPVYYVLHTRKRMDLIQYFDAIFQDKSFQQSLWGLGNGIMFLQSKTTGKFNTIRLRIPMSKLRRVIVTLPPPDEQAAIVKFLDYANGKIERAIRAKRKLIGLLNEQKQAIIHRAVTRGLDPNVKLKPSGIPWLGDIPQHWEVVRNMALFAHRVEPGEAGLPVLQVSLRSGITAEDLDQFGRPKRLIADPKKYKRIQTGDVAYNTMRMWQGAVGVAPSDGLVSPAYVVLRPRRGTCSEFYDSLFHTEVYKQQVNRQSTGIVSDRNRLYWDSFKQMSNISLPRSEQDEIVLYIKAETLGLNSAVLRLEREIDLLREYRTTLTAEVVTGKLDVREASKRLPDQTDDPLPADESLDDLDDEITEEVEA